MVVDTKEMWAVGERRIFSVAGTSCAAGSSWTEKEPRSTERGIVAVFDYAYSRRRIIQMIAPQVRKPAAVR